MFCRECGKEIDDNAAFCIYCGKPTANAGVSNNVILNGNEDKKKKATKKTKIIGIIAIIILVVIVFMLAAGGTTSKVTDTAGGTTSKVADTAGETADKATGTAGRTAETSALNDIIGDWHEWVNIGSPTYASTFEKPSYLRVEAEGITALTYVVLNRLYYAIGVDDISIQEENGIKYYAYSAELYSSRVAGESESGIQKIGIRLYLDEVSGWLVCEFNAPGDGFWQRVGAYEPLDISLEEHDEKVRMRFYSDEREALENSVKEKYFTTLEEALADDDFRNWFEYKTGMNGHLLSWTNEYDADGNNLVLDVKLREERWSPDSYFISYCTQDEMNEWISEWSEMVSDQDGSNPITVTVRCLSSDGKESVERTFVRETQIETLEEYYSDPARAYYVVPDEIYKWENDDFDVFEAEGSLDVTGNDMVVTIRFENMDVSLSQDFALFIYEYLESWDDSYADIVSDLDTIVNEPGACTYTLRFTDPDNVVFAEKTYSNR